MADILEPEMKPWRVAAAMFSAFGGLALLIAVVGLYGVVSSNASYRATELAVRIALGARPRHVLYAVAGEGLRAVLVGLTVGAFACLIGGRWMGSMLFGTSARDPAILGGVFVLLFAVAVVACLMPTWQVVRQGPASVLRGE
jgi:ABC-type antimicrobial peptide transport system permease subunit